MGTDPQKYIEGYGMQIKLISLQPSEMLFPFFAGLHVYQYTVIAIMEGGIELVSGNSALTLQPLQICMLPADCFPATGANQACRFWMLQFTEAFALAALYTVNENNAIRLLGGHLHCLNADESTFKIFKKMLLLLYMQQSKIADNPSEIMRLTFNLLLSCLAEMNNATAIIPKRHLPRKEYVATQFLTLASQNAGAHHDVAYYAGILCMSRGNLAKIIKETTGRTPKSIIEEILIRAATELLDHSIESIYLIAEELHFKCSSAFVNFFRIHTGRTPNDYRNRNKE